MYYTSNVLTIDKIVNSETWYCAVRQREVYLQDLCHFRVQLLTSTFQLGPLYVSLLHLCRKMSHLFCKIEIKSMRLHKVKTAFNIT